MANMVLTIQSQESRISQSLPFNTYGDFACNVLENHVREQIKPLGRYSTEEIYIAVGQDLNADLLKLEIDFLFYKTLVSRLCNK
ncbi:unnamed protein product [Dovyalis caffra]|uniref:Uncharacterized protein n=1 Tax=Dovyalis caffra TaxID=77055 RepID=A0AAV1SRX5_9ROSI|nr:unnamed protein product [Dovyalis caffra]